MLEKPKRVKQLNNQDRQLPATIQELINRYDLENKDIYKFLDYLVDSINENKSEVVDNLESKSITESLSANQGRILNEIKQDRNFIKSFQLEEDTGDFRIDGLDIIEDGGTYEVEMYLQHSKVNDFAVGIQINNLTDSRWVYQGIDSRDKNSPTGISSYGSDPVYGRLGAIRNNYTTIIKFTIHKADYSFGGSLRYYIDAICMNGNFIEHTISQYYPENKDINLTSIRIINTTNTEVFQSGSYVKVYKK